MTGLKLWIDVDIQNEHDQSPHSVIVTILFEQAQLITVCVAVKNFTKRIWYFLHVIYDYQGDDSTPWTFSILALCIMYAALNRFVHSFFYLVEQNTV